MASSSLASWATCPIETACSIIRRFLYYHYRYPAKTYNVSYIVRSNYKYDATLAIL
jgi:hypothetical protein